MITSLSAVGKWICTYRANTSACTRNEHRFAEEAGGVEDGHVASLNALESGCVQDGVSDCSSGVRPQDRQAPQQGCVNGGRACAQTQCLRKASQCGGPELKVISLLSMINRPWTFDSHSHRLGNHRHLLTSAPP